MPAAATCSQQRSLESRNFSQAARRIRLPAFLLASLLPLPPFLPFFASLPLVFVVRSSVRSVASADRFRFAIGSERGRRADRRRNYFLAPISPTRPLFSVSRWLLARGGFHSSYSCETISLEASSGFNIKSFLVRMWRLGGLLKAFLFIFSVQCVVLLIMHVFCIHIMWSWP